MRLKVNVSSRVCEVSLYFVGSCDRVMEMPSTRSFSKSTGAKPYWEQMASNEAQILGHYQIAEFKSCLSNTVLKVGWDSSQRARRFGLSGVGSRKLNYYFRRSWCFTPQGYRPFDLETPASEIYRRVFLGRRNKRRDRRRQEVEGKKEYEAFRSTLRYLKGEDSLRKWDDPREYDLAEHFNVPEVRVWEDFLNLAIPLIRQGKSAWDLFLEAVFNSSIPGDFLYEHFIKKLTRILSFFDVKTLRIWMLKLLADKSQIPKTFEVSSLLKALYDAIEEKQRKPSCVFCNLFSCPPPLEYRPQLQPNAPSFLA